MTWRPSAELYPFESRMLGLQGGVRMHYLNEGPRDGRPVVMLHGNPTWSFYFRDLVKELRRDRRVIVPDHVGCGLSDKPGDDRYEYTLESRVRDLETLLERLGIRKGITLVLHDWGGMIGMAWASRRPEAVERLVILNTAGFLLPEGKALPASLKFGRDSALAALLIRRFNAFSSTASWVCSKKGLPCAVRRAYVKPYGSWDDRIATLRFVQDIPLGPGDRAYELVRSVQDGLERFRKVPMLICWGRRDFVFDDAFLAEWRRRFPGAETHVFEDAGHYVLEDAGDRIAPLVRAFLDR